MHRLRDAEKQKTIKREPFCNLSREVLTGVGTFGMFVSYLVKQNSEVKLYAFGLANSPLF